MSAYLTYMNVHIIEHVRKCAGYDNVPMNTIRIVFLVHELNAKNAFNLKNQDADLIYETTYMCIYKQENQEPFSSFYINYRQFNHKQSSSEVTLILLRIITKTNISKCNILIS